MSHKVSKFTHLFALSLLLSLLAVFSSCKEEELIIEVESIELNESSITLKEDESVTLSATIHPANATYSTIIWGSNDETIANIYNHTWTAEVYGSGAGSTTIFVETFEGRKHRAECTVKVLPKEISVEGISLSDRVLSMVEGDEYQLTADVYPSYSTNKNIIWKSSNTSVATVNAGKVTAVQAGETTITATTEDGEKTATCDVTVTAKVYPVTGISLSHTTVDMAVGEKFTITAAVEPVNATNKNLIWSSDNSNIASIENGVITACSEGNTTIRVTTEDGNITASCDINVRIPVTNISLSTEKMEMCPEDFCYVYVNGEDLYEGSIGFGYVLNIFIDPENASNHNVTITSSNESVATYSDGIIRAISSGISIMTVTTEDGGLSTALVVEVVNYVPSWGICGDFNNWGESGREIVMQETEDYYVAKDFSAGSEGKGFMFRFNKDMEQCLGHSEPIILGDNVDPNAGDTWNNERYTLKQGGYAIRPFFHSHIDIYLSKSLDYFIMVPTGQHVEASIDYIDEWGNNYGKGQIDKYGTVWAPVNCGYRSGDPNHPCGDLYQWGRQYGQSWDAGIQTIEGDHLSMSELSEEYPDKFIASPYSGKVWYSDFSDVTWDNYTDDSYNNERNKQKTKTDPCPEGWRIPTVGEFEGIKTVSPFTLESPQLLECDYYWESDGEVVRDNTTQRYWTSTYYYGPKYYKVNVKNETQYSEGSFLDGYPIRCVQE